MARMQKNALAPIATSSTVADLEELAGRVQGLSGPDRAFRVRIYPEPAQESRLLQWAGIARFTYNAALEQRRDWWRNFKHNCGQNISFATQSKEMTEAKAAIDWLQDSPRSVIEYALRDLDRAFRAWFQGAGYPKFRSKDRGISFRVQGRDCRITKLNAKWAQIDLGKGLLVKARVTHGLPAKMNAVAFRRVGAHWYAAIIGQDATSCAAANDAPVGIDRGVSVTLAMSNGEHHRMPDSIARVSKKRRSAQRALARTKRGSSRRAKQKVFVQRHCAREAATRAHWLHERSTDIANRFGQVAIEKLNTGNMTRAGRGKHGLNRSILEQGWAMFADMLAYKLADRGGVLHFVSPAYTSQTCSCCGSVNAESRKSQAVFECVDCGHRANADTNAAINILRRSPAGVEGAGYGPVEARTGAASRRRKNPHGYVSGEAEPNSVYG